MELEFATSQPNVFYNGGFGNTGEAANHGFQHLRFGDQFQTPISTHYGLNLGIPAPLCHCCHIDWSRAQTFGLKAKLQQGLRCR